MVAARRRARADALREAGDGYRASDAAIAAVLEARSEAMRPTAAPPSRVRQSAWSRQAS
jgi:hypothetical protein